MTSRQKSAYEYYEGAFDTTASERPSIWQLMWEDAKAALARDPAADSLWDIFMFSTGTHIVWAYRRQHWLYTHGLRKLALWLAKRTRRKLGGEIHPAARIGRRFTIDHGMGVVIGGTSIIGDDCMMYQGVTLGMTGKQLGGKRHPTLGNNVFIGANAVLLGSITVGDNTRIGAGAVVVDDVSDGATMVGVPARIVRQQAREEFRVVSGSGRRLEPYEGDTMWSCAL